MNVKEEVLSTIQALQKTGFQAVDAVFEGAIGVKDDDTLAFMDTLNDKQLASGVVRIIYTAPDKNVRFVEIPVGKQSPEEEEGQ